MRIRRWVESAPGGHSQVCSLKAGGYPSGRVISVRRGNCPGAGIPFVDESGRRAGLHSLRKTFGTALALNGEHPRVVLEAMRHSDLKLTMKIYIDAGQLPVGAALKRLPWNRGARKEAEKSA